MKKSAAAGESRTDWLLLLVVAAETIVLLLQKTKQAFLPAKQTPVLWVAVLVSIAGAIILRSGLWRDSRWAHEQARLGTLANNFYEPRREALINGFTIGVGVFASLWWAAATWGVLFMGMRRGNPTRGLADFIVAGVAGALSGGVLGAVIGLYVGHVWETRHRQSRLARRAANA